MQSILLYSIIVSSFSILLSVFTLKGKKVNLKASSGIVAENKMVAKKNDLAVGVDLHDRKVPASKGLKTVPAVPHPYIGKLVDKLSQDVTIDGQPAVTKDSKSKYDTPGHMPMPPGVKFRSRPSNEGVVSSGTVPSVKVNGKEIAVIGSKVNYPA